MIDITSMGWLGWQMLTVITIALIGTVGISFVGWFRQRFNLDVDIVEERAGGALTEFQLKGRVFNNDGIKTLQLGRMFSWNLKTLPTPNPAGITLGRNGRERAKYYKALNGEFYQILITKRVPTHGTIKEDGSVEFDKWDEIVFSPVNQDHKTFARNELKRAYETHKNKNFWERHGGLVALLGVAACVALVLIVLIWYVVGVAKDVNSTTANLIQTANLARAVALP